MEPVRLALELGISDKTLRGWLRRTFPRHLGDKGTSWSLTPEQIATAEQRWGTAGQVRSVSATRQVQSTASGKQTKPAGVGGPASRAALPVGDAKTTLAQLTTGSVPVSATITYSNQPGIYGVFYLGGEFPLPGAGVTKGTLVYIGKTESSQLTRDSKQHLADGETGHSTLRRTFAALLRTRLGLRPCSRSETEESDRRFKHYKLDDQGERKLTAWMRENLGLAFAPCSCSVAEVRRLESEMIRAAVPVLNLAGNAANPYLRQIKAARAKCVALARQADHSR